MRQSRHQTSLSRLTTGEEHVCYTTSSKGLLSEQYCVPAVVHVMSEFLPPSQALNHPHVCRAQTYGGACQSSHHGTSPPYGAPPGPRPPPLQVQACTYRQAQESMLGYSSTPAMHMHLLALCGSLKLQWPPNEASVKDLVNAESRFCPGTHLVCLSAALKASSQSRAVSFPALFTLPPT